MTVICYIFIFIFEQFVSLMYFNNKFYLKSSKFYLYIILVFSFLIQFFGNYIGNKFSFPEVNLITFFICNILFVLLLFKATIKQAFFNVVLLEGLMVTSELGVMHLTSILLKINLQEYLSDNTVIILETIGTKTLYFTIAYLISKFSTKEKQNKNKNKIKDTSYFLFILPVLSIFIIISFTHLSIKYNTDNYSKVTFTLISIILLFFNILIFIVHEKMLKALCKNTELQLEAQKNKINEEYYKNIQAQYELSNILIHDIKKCLTNIKNFANNNDNELIAEYVDSIYKGYDIKKLKQYSNNKLVNVIVSRYSELCSIKNIDFSVDIRNIDFSFLSNSDLTAILDNLLENAYEAAELSNKRAMNLYIDKINENYNIFEISNTTDKALEPNIHITTKNDKGYHGIGLQSVTRIVKLYSGDINYMFNVENKTFTVTVLIKGC